MISNRFYEIEYRPERNRFYLKVKGYWDTVEKAQEYFEDWKKMHILAKNGFTVLADLTEMKAPIPEIGEYHAKAQKYLLEHGMVQVAEIIESPITMTSVNNMANFSGMMPFKKAFEDQADAEEWLNTFLS